MVDNSKYDIIIDNHTKNLFIKEGDSCYTDLYPKHKTYIAMPFLTYQQAGYSDIGERYIDYPSIRIHL